MPLSRRDFLHATTAAAAFGGLVSGVSGQTPPAGAGAAGAGKSSGGSRPVVISSANGLRSTQRAADMILAGADTLEAVVEGVVIVEEDPSDDSVGYGGLPNEDGVVELDACVMHGPTCRAGSVASLRNIKTPSRVAKLVLERTDHVMIVGEGALRFARAHGFEETNLLTEESRKKWLHWKETRDGEDDWLPPPEVEEHRKGADARPPVAFTYGTINCCAVNAAGEVSGVTTTSGLSWKIPGRVGDSPIIGAGLYVDNEVGAAGATGRGEACIKICGSHTVVEAMRQGMSPTEACLEAMRRVVRTTTEKRLRHSDGRPNFDLKFYALARDGRFGGASMWSGAEFAVWSDGRNRLEPCAFLYERPAGG
jgi:N4-(beta-N-acetylglucosaminyl)-L-asparaginase